MTNRTLITGAASGIGRATAELLAVSGHSLVLADRNADALSGVLADAPAITRLVGDVADEIFWQNSIAHLDGLTGAVVNAGIATGGAIANLTFAEWRQTLSTNLDGAFLTLRAVMRVMLAHDQGGAIVTVSSVSGIKPEPGVAAYGASKAGLIHLTRVAAREGAPRGIRVNAIAPGGVDTPIWDGIDAFADMVADHAGDRDAALGAMAQATTPLARYASASEIAGQIAFLLSDGAKSMTGAVMVVDGGYSV